MSLAHHARGFRNSAVLRANPKRGLQTRAWAAAPDRLRVKRNHAILCTTTELTEEEPPARGTNHQHNGREARITVLKDNFATSELPTTCASLILQGFKSPQDSTVGCLLRDAGIFVAAKTNMDEFGMGSHSIHSAYEAVQNGVGSTAQSAGGSSGGSAMAVADSMVKIAIGSDTGGSVRLPAAYTGTIGFKPSYGRISRNGLVPYANSLDTVGIIAATVLDAMAAYKILDKADVSDPTCLTPSSRQRIQYALHKRDLKPKHDQADPDKPRIRVVPDALDGSTTEAIGKYPDLERRYERKGPYRIGVPDEYNIEEMHPLVRQAWLRTLSLLSQRGHNIQPISLPTTQQALAAYYVLAPAEASSNLAKYDGVRYGTPRSSEHPDNHDGPLYSHYRGKFFGDEVKRRILLGTFSLSAGAMDNYFIQAQKVRRLVQQDFNAAFALPHPLIDTPATYHNSTGVDFIVVPTAPTPPPLLSEVREQSPLDSYINDVFTVPASLAGLPAISIPVLAGDDIPPIPERNVGMQVIGQYGDDNKVLSFARHEIEANMYFDDRLGATTLNQTRM